jgi:hypothetical protein
MERAHRCDYVTVSHVRRNDDQRLRGIRRYTVLSISIGLSGYVAEVRPIGF